MNITITTETENKAMSRTELEGSISFTGKTPSADEVKKKIAEMKKAKEELVVVKNISTHFGEQTASLSAVVYTDKKKMDLIEPKKKEKKKKEGEGGEGEKKEAPKEGAKKEDKPAEDKKEEAKKEEKPKEEKPAADTTEDKSSESQAKPEKKEEPKPEKKK